MNNKKTVLIVEDDASLNKALVEKITNEGLGTLSVRNGVDCMDAIKKGGVDLVVLDLVMPEMGGVDVLKKLNSEEVTKNIPVVILSNLSDINDLSEVMEQGAYDYFVKADHPIGDIVDHIKIKLQ